MRSAFAFVLLLAACRTFGVVRPPKVAPPVDDPGAPWGVTWTAALPWGRVVNIADVAGETLDARLQAAQDDLRAAGGGVIFFPPGLYRFADSIILREGVILRGADPAGTRDARDERYALPTRFEFPRYLPRQEGAGTPVTTAFKGIYVEDPATTSNVGLVHLHIERGHVAFRDADDHRAGRNRLVVGCVLRNTAVASREVPDLAAGQHAWQRYTDRFGAAIAVHGENLLIARNRLPRSGEANFVQKGYVLAEKGQRLVPPDGVTFDHDNRPGIIANSYVLGGLGGSGADGTPETHPHGFRKGIVIRENFVYATGRTAIAFAGDGVICNDNVIRFAQGIVRWTTTGKNITSASSTNDNRAVQMRGWRWHVEGNDYQVFRHLSADLKNEVNDGEGLMHEDHANSTVVDSRLIRNRGNAYLSIYKTGGIDGLLIQGNEISTPGGLAAVFAVANRNAGPFPCAGVRVLNNVTAGTGIRVACEPATDVVVEGNRHRGAGGKLQLPPNAIVRGNQGYTP